MKFKSIFILLFLFIGSMGLDAQINVASATTVKGGKRDCAKIENFKQECDKDGNVHVQFYVGNYSGSTVSYFNVYLNGVFFTNVNNLNFQSGTVLSTPITHTIPAGDVANTEELCFTIKMYNSKGLCCHVTSCYKIEGCICVDITYEVLLCANTPDVYNYCITILNPSYATNTIDQITLFPTGNNSGICVNSVENPMANPQVAPFPISLNNPIAPGSSGLICFTIEGCNAPIPSGTDLDFTLIFEDTTDPDYCCHSDVRTVTTPECCDVVDDCTQFTFTRNGDSQPTDDHNETIISGVTATINFCFNTQTITDRLVVTVNGAVGFDSGDWSTDGPFSSGTGSCGLPAMGIYTNSINVNPCDVVVIDVFGDTCPIGFTGWDLGVACDALPTCPNPNNGSSSLSSEAIAAQASNPKRLNQVSTSNALELFPNPVSDILTIKNTDIEASYGSIRVLDASGKEVKNETMSGNSDFRMDVSSLPLGTYFMEARDNKGNTKTARFVKIK